MAAEDFPTSPAKRQRTESPETSRDQSSIQELQPVEHTANGLPNETSQNVVDGTTAARNGEDAATSVRTLQAPNEESVQQPQDQDSNSLLDALMLQVEAQSSSVLKLPPLSAPTVTDAAQSAEGANAEIVITEQEITPSTKAIAEDETQQSSTDQPAIAPADAMDVTDGVVLEDTDSQTRHQEVEGSAVADTNSSIPTVGNTAGAPAIPGLALPDITAIDPIPASETQAPDPGAEGAEWEVDSSPYESSDSDTSDDTSSDDDSDDDADGEYSMLDPEETARILMQGDGGSDDEGGKSRDKADGAPTRTANERVEEVIPKPDIVVTEDMKIEELGNVEFVVENNVVIKAKTSGEYQVLEAGSLICLKDRTVVGVVADLIGRVEEPRYTIRFTNDEAIAEAGLSAAGTTVFYVPTHSTFVFTQPLKAVKGSDASNFHDEEVGEDEMEFSDDEAEAEHKRQMKARRQGKVLDTGRGRGGSKFGRGSQRGGRRGSHSRNFDNNNVANGSGAYGDGSLEMNYDDVSNGGDDGYTPLQRPDNFAGNVSKEEQPRGDGMTYPLPPPPPSFRGGRGDSGGRGRGHARGGRGGFRSQRGGGGGYHQSRGAGFNNQQNGSHGYRSTAPLPEVSLPTTPSITPHNGAFTPMTPSPMSPLPNVPYNFGGYPPPPGFPYMQQSVPGFQPPPFPHQLQQQQQQQQQQQYQQPYQPTQNHAPGTQPYHGNQPSQPSYATQPNPAAQPSFPFGPWANNPALAAALQRQVEEQRRNQGM